MSEIVCLQCGSSIRAGARYCAICGSQVVAVQVTQPSAPDVAPEPPETEPESSDAAVIVRVICSRCGKPLRVGARFCSTCGHPVKLVESPVLQIQPESLTSNNQSISPISPPTAPPQPPDIIYTPTIPPDFTEPRPLSAAAPAPAKSRLGYRARHGVIIAVLVLLLGLFLVGAYVLDLNEPEIALPTPQIASQFADTWFFPTASPDKYIIQIGLSEDGRFGLQTTFDGLPSEIQGKKLTFDTNGATNNTRIWIDGDTPIIGETDLTQYLRAVKGNPPSDWEWKNGDINVTQVLEYVVSGSGDGDTLRIEYRIENTGKVAHEVGLRLMIDTLIGENDGVPFLIPGQEGLTISAIDLRSEEIPDQIKALEKETLENPGIIINLILKGSEATTPDRVLITGWIDKDVEWDYLQTVGGVGAPLRRGGKPDGIPDSAVGLFFDPEKLAPGQVRTIVTYYGLGNISSVASGNKKLSLSAAFKVRQGESFYVSAIVAQPYGIETISIHLPKELRLVEGEVSEKTVEDAGQPYTQVSWLVQACKPATEVKIEVVLQPGEVVETWSLAIDPISLTRSGGICP